MMKELLKLCFVTLTPFAALAEAQAPPPANAHENVDSLFVLAEAQAKADNFAGAVETYQQILAELPTSARAQQASFKAAQYLEGLQRPHDALSLYDRTIEIGNDLLKPRYYKVNGQKQTISAGNLDSVQDRIERSLKREAVLCELLGNPAKGLKAIDCLRVFAPTSRAVADLIPLRLQFQGLPASDAALLSSREREAAELCHQAEVAQRTDGPDAALPLLERVLVDYGSTAAAMRAGAEKARILWSRHRYEDAHTIYKQILDKAGPAAPDVKLVRTARYRVAWFLLTSLTKASELKVRAGEKVSDDQWQSIRNACRIVIDLDPDPLERAEASITLISSFDWQGRYEECLDAANDFFRDYSGSREGQSRLHRQICFARLFKGDALERLGRTDEAAKQYKAIIDWDAAHPGLLQNQGKLLHRAKARMAILTANSAEE